jgi:catechol 2,3-dioxygenase-like lactoylglutathione lyase family enzyme
MKIFFGLQHVALQTNHFEQALVFYRDTLGLRLLKKGTSAKGRQIAWFQTGPTTIELYSGKPGQTLEKGWNVNSVGPLHIALQVENLEKAILFLKSKGVRILKEPFEPVPGERAAFIEGPDQEEIELTELPIG